MVFCVKYMDRPREISILMETSLHVSYCIQVFLRGEYENEQLAAINGCPVNEILFFRVKAGYKYAKIN